MVRTAILLVPMFAVCAASAQNADTEIVSADSGGSVPVTTVVTVQDTPLHTVDSTTVYEPVSKKKSRAERRAAKADDFATRIDSLVRSRNFVFYPNSMQEIPNGEMQLIYADYFYFGLESDTAAIHLPATDGKVMQYVGMLNFDAPIADYKLLPFQSGMTSTFSITHNGSIYFCRLVVSAVTGETALTIVTPDTTMRYIGWLSRERRARADENAEDL